ncbi:MAG TPA: PQQ-binding-like beta-propeller repeat protein [Planctomycetota bacterium]|nr:PQQ-binding-like beta-propeller repeat protein [Planctomycetota bacterium]
MLKTSKRIAIPHTEVEIYGPLGGAETARGWPADPEAAPMFMSTPSHARAAAKVDLSADVVVSSMKIGIYTPLPAMDVTDAGVAMVDGKLYYGTAPGQLIVTGRDDAGNWRENARGNTGSVSLTGTPALYSARMLVPSADGSLYCLAAADCSVQWKYQAGGRMLSSPAPDGDDVYVGSDDGSIYKLDIESVHNATSRHG